MYSILSLLAFVITTNNAWALDNSLAKLPPDKSQLSLHFLLGSELSKSQENLQVTCSDLIAFADSAPGGNVKAKCSFIGQNRADIPKSDLVISVKEDFVGDYLIDFQQASWRVNAPAPEPKTSLFITKEHHGIPHYIRALVHNVLAYHRSQDSLKRFFLEVGVSDSKTVSYKDDQFYKLPQKEKISWKKAYELFTNENDKSKNYMRTSLEMVLILASGTAWYYRNWDFNAVDFDHPHFGRSMRTRFTSFDALRHDNNGSVNRSHLNIVGPAHYLFARSNGLSRTESYLASFITSSLWEYFVEFREVVSINDMVMTPVAGYVFGEVIYNLSRLFKSPGRHKPYLSGAINPILAFHNWLDKLGRGKPVHQDHGFDESVFGKFEIYIANTKKEVDGHAADESTTFGVEGEVLDVAIDEGKSVYLILDRTVFNNFYVLSTYKSSGFAETVMTAKASVFFAYHAKDLFKNHNGKIEGYSVVVGPTQGVDISYSKDKNAKYRDMIMNLHVIGNTIDVTRYLPEGVLRMTLDTHGTYAQLRSAAFEEYRKDHELEGVQSTLINDNTYFAFGSTAALKASATFSVIEIGGSWKYDQFYGINKRTRFLETETNYLDLSDSRITRGAHIKFNITKNSFLKCGYQYTKRSGSVEEIVQIRKEKVRECSINYSFR